MDSTEESDSQELSISDPDGVAVSPNAHRRLAYTPKPSSRDLRTKDTSPGARKFLIIKIVVAGFLFVVLGLSIGLADSSKLKVYKAPSIYKESTFLLELTPQITNSVS